LRDQLAAPSLSPGHFADRGRDDAGPFFGQVVPGAADDADGQLVRVRPGAGEAVRGQRAAAGRLRGVVDLAVTATRFTSHTSKTYAVAALMSRCRARQDSMPPPPLPAFDFEAA